jgi:Protein of unknown function (DUF1579)
MARISVKTPAPRPDPQVKKLSVLVGHWTFKGEYKAGPLGPGGKVAGEYTGRMILGGFFFEGRLTEKAPFGEMRGLEVEAYDPANKSFVSNWYLSGGSAISGMLTVSGNTFSWEGKLKAAGKQYQYKQTLILAADLASWTIKAEISVDGKTWTPWFEERGTKVKPAAKK